MRTPWLRGAVLAALTLAAGACATVPPATISTHAEERDAVHEHDLARHERLDTFQALQRLRPHWLSSRGQSALVEPAREGVRVYLDGMPGGDVSFLRRIPVSTVGEIRFLDSRQATLRFGTGHASGALLVTTRHGFASSR